MSTNFFFKSLRVDNYRGIKDLKISSLRRVNLIGGLNGAGKSTLLEIIFLFLDRRSPVALMRPFVIRGVQMPFPDGFNYIFGGKESKKVLFSGKTLSGEVEMSLSLDKLPVSMNISAQGNSMQPFQGSLSTSEQSQLGVHIKTKLNGRDDEASCALQVAPDSVNFNNYKPGVMPLVAGVTVSATSRVTPVEDAQRYSLLFKSGRVAEVIRALKFVNEGLTGFQLLQEGNQPVLYAMMSDGSMLQTNMLGGGFQSVLSIALMMMTTKDGVILFDEVDSAIHYSRLNFFWDLVSRLADQQNCQVFAVTHSRECISSALAGFDECGRLADLQYLRLENNINVTDCITYSGEELKEAIASNWEIR